MVNVSQRSCWCKSIRIHFVSVYINLFFNKLDIHDKSNWICSAQNFAPRRLCYSFLITLGQKRPFVDHFNSFWFQSYYNIHTTNCGKITAAQRNRWLLARDGHTTRHSYLLWYTEWYDEILFVLDFDVIQRHIRFLCKVPDHLEIVVGNWIGHEQSFCFAVRYVL